MRDEVLLEEDEEEEEEVEVLERQRITEVLAVVAVAVVVVVVVVRRARERARYWEAIVRSIERIVWVVRKGDEEAIGGAMERWIGE